LLQTIFVIKIGSTAALLFAWIRFANSSILQKCCLMPASNGCNESPTTNTTTYTALIMITTWFIHCHTKVSLGCKFTEPVDSDGNKKVAVWENFTCCYCKDPATLQRCQPHGRLHQKTVFWLLLGSEIRHHP
jgi:hypothetical protein